MSLPLEDSTLLDPSIIAKTYNPPCPTKKSDHPFIKLLKRIRDFVIDFFKSFIELFKPSPNLSERLIDKIQNAIVELKKARGLDLKNRSWVIEPHLKPIMIPDGREPVQDRLDLAGPKPQVDNRNIPSKNLVDSMSLDSSIHSNKLLQVPRRNFGIPPSIAGSGMENLYIQGQRMVNMAVDVVYKEKAAPIVESIQKGWKQAPAILKTITDIGKVVDFQAFHALYEKFAKNVEIQQKVNPEIKQLLTWLAKEMPQDFQASLKKQILENDKKAEPDKLEKYVQPLCEWIKSNHADPLMSYYKNIDGIDVHDEREEQKVNAILQDAVKILLEHKLNKFMKLLKKRLGKQLPIIVKGMMHENAEIISSGILERIISILGAMMDNTELPYPSMVDALIGVVHHHTNALIAVDAEKQKAIKNSHTEIEKTKLAANAAANEKSRIQKAIKNAHSKIEKTKLDASAAANEKSLTTLIGFLNEIHLMGKKVYIEEAGRDAADAAAKKAFMKEKETINKNKQIAANNNNLEDPSKADAEAFLKKVAQMGEQNYLKAEIQKAEEKARKKAEKKAESEYRKHQQIKDADPSPKNEQAKKEAASFIHAITLQGEEAYATREAKKAEAQPYVNHSGGTGSRVCHPFIAALLENSKQDDRKKIYNDFADLIVQAMLPQQKVIALEERFKATIALNIDRLKPIFQKILEDAVDKKLDERKAHEEKLIEELYEMCRGFREIGAFVNVEGKERIHDKFEDLKKATFKQLIRPLVDNINAKILHTARTSTFSSKLDVDEVANAMRAYLYPKVESKDPDLSQIQAEALLKKKQLGMVQVDQLAMIRSNLAVAEIQKLIQEAKTFAAEMISEDAKGGLTDLVKTGLDIFGSKIEKSALNWVKKEMRKQVSSMIQENVERFSDPEKLNEIAGTVLLPTMTQQTLQVFGRSLISQHVSTFAEDFKKLALYDKNDKKGYKEERKKIFNKIADKLYKKTEKALEKSKTDFKKLTPEEYREIISPTLAHLASEIERLPISQIKQSIEQSITAALNPKALFESDKRLGALAYNALTKLGGLREIETARDILLPLSLGFFDLRDFLINLISDIASIAMQDIRLSPQAVVDSAVNTIEKKFPEEKAKEEANKEKIKEMLFETPIPKTKKEADQTKAEEIKKISKIAYDLVFYQMKQKINALKLPLPHALEVKAKAAVISKVTNLIKPKMIAKAITDIYQKTIGCNRLMNENLAIQCQRIVFSAMREASDRLQENSVPTIVASVPKLIPALV